MAVPSWFQACRVMDYVAVCDSELALEEYWRRWWHHFHRLLVAWTHGLLNSDDTAELREHLSTLLLEWLANRKIMQGSETSTIRESLSLAVRRSWLSASSEAGVRYLVRSVEEGSIRPALDDEQGEPEALIVGVANAMNIREPK